MEEVNKPEEETPESVETEYYFEPAASPSEDISAAYTALLATDGVDPGMTDDRWAYEEKIRVIRMDCIDIIYNRIKYIKEGLTDESAESE